MGISDPSFLKKSVAFHASRQLVDCIIASRTPHARQFKHVVISENLCPNLFSAFSDQRFEKIAGRNGYEIVIHKPVLSGSHRCEESKLMRSLQRVIQPGDALRVFRKALGAPTLETQKRASKREEIVAVERCSQLARVLTAAEARTLIDRLTEVRGDVGLEPICVSVMEKRLRRSHREQQEYTKSLIKPRAVSSPEPFQHLPRLDESEELKPDPRKQFESMSRLARPRTLEQMFSRYLQHAIYEEKEESMALADFNFGLDLTWNLPGPDLSAYASDLGVEALEKTKTNIEANSYLEEALNALSQSLIEACELNPEKCGFVEEYIRLQIIPSLSRRPVRHESKKYASPLCGETAEAVTFLNKFQPSELCLLRMQSLLCMLKA